MPFIRAAIVTMAFLASGFTAGAQQPPAAPADIPLAFEVASVRINKSGDLQTQFSIPPGSGRVAVTNMQLRGLIQSAYRVPAQQLTNLPAWANTMRVDIVAKADPAASVQQLQTMLQPLLVERFKLKFHYEPQERDVYTLVRVSPDRLGAHITQAAGSCEALGAAPRNTLPAPETQKTQVCGLIPSGPGRIVARGFDMRAFIAILNLNAGALGGRQILDETGLTGAWDVDLTYTPEALSAAALANRTGDPPPLAAQVDPYGPNLFQALQDQLGLKLEAAKRPLQVMVVDHIEQPIED